MTTLEIGQKLVDLCRQGQHKTVLETLYAPDIISVEARILAHGSAETHGLKALAAKSQWWQDNHTIHSEVAEGPYPNGDRFIVHFKYEITFKPTGERRQVDETALYTVANDKIVREEFFYRT